MLPRSLIMMLATAMLLFTLQVHATYDDGNEGMISSNLEKGNKLTLLPSSYQHHRLSISSRPGLQPLAWTGL